MQNPLNLIKQIEDSNKYYTNISSEKVFKETVLPNLLKNPTFKFMVISHNHVFYTISPRIFQNSSKKELEFQTIMTSKLKTEINNINVIQEISILKNRLEKELINELKIKSSNINYITAFIRLLYLKTSKTYVKS